MAHHLGAAPYGGRGAPRHALVALRDKFGLLDAPSPRRREEVAKFAGPPRVSDLEASAAELAIVPSESFLEEIHSDDPLGSDSEGHG